MSKKIKNIFLVYLNIIKKYVKMVITKFWRNYDKKIISTDIFNISKLYSFK